MALTPPPWPRKRSLYATLGWVLDYGRSAAAHHNAQAILTVGRVNNKDNRQTVDFTDEQIKPLEKWQGGGFDDVEKKGLKFEWKGEKKILTWRTTNRLQKRVWDDQIEDRIDREIERLSPYLKKYSFTSLEFGRDWTTESGLVQRKWLEDKIKRIRRFNASPAATKSGVFLVLRAAHIEVQTGNGLLRPMRPHWHLVVMIRRYPPGKNQRRRLDLAVAQLRQLVAAEVTYKWQLARDQLELRRLLEYLLRYPAQLVHPTDMRKDGLRRKIDLDAPKEGLRLVTFPPAWSKWKKREPAALVSHPVPSAWDGLTDPFVLLDPFKALAGLKNLQSYSPPSRHRRAKTTKTRQTKK